MTLARTIDRTVARTRTAAGRIPSSAAGAGHDALRLSPGSAAGCAGKAGRRRLPPLLLAPLACATLLLAGPLRAETAIDASKPPPQTAGVAIPPGQIDAALAKLDGLAEGLLAETKVPGLAVAVVRDGRTVYAKGFGLRKIGAPEKVDADTVFQIASLSKAVGATVVAHQVSKGVVGWDTPVSAHLPWFVLSDAWVSRHLTIADLYSHRSGLPDHAGDELEDLGYDRRQILERLRLLPLAPFRAAYAYTNFGLTAAAEAVAVASGTDWASLCESVLYKPLGMASTSSRFADFMARQNRATPHTKIDGVFVAKYQRDPDAQSPAGGVSTNVTDLARWMALILGNGSFEGRELVPQKALLPAIRAEMISSPAYAADARASYYGFGFGVNVSPAGRVVLDHSGAFTMGAATQFLMIPSAGIGIISLTNGSPVGLPEALDNAFADLVQFGTVTRDWLAAYQPLIAPGNKPQGSLVGKEPPANPEPASPLQAYTGRYGNAYFGDAVVTARDGELTLTLGPKDEHFPLRHWSGDDFVFTPRAESANPGSRSQARFVTESDGPMEKMVLEFYDENGLGTWVRK